MRQVFVLVVKDLFGHAVLAAKVATICDADAQIVQRPVAQVAQASARLEGLLWQSQFARA